MSSIKLMEEALPVAPLKIAALESCEELGKRLMIISSSSAKTG